MSLASKAFLIGNEIPQEDADQGIKRQLFGYGDTILMARVTFEEGAVGTVHAHEHAQATYVESGEFDVFVDGVEKRLGAGDGFYVQPNLDHGAVCRKPGVLIDVFSPARLDFLEETPAT